eukprot:COSAG01_NODE_1641_length_9647_cov_5.299539_15_plen_196_part_00
MAPSAPGCRRARGRGAVRCPAVGRCGSHDDHLMITLGWGGGAFSPTPFSTVECVGDRWGGARVGVAQGQEASVAAGREPAVTILESVHVDWDLPVSRLSSSRHQLRIWTRPGQVAVTGTIRASYRVKRSEELRAMALSRGLYLATRLPKSDEQVIDDLMPLLRAEIAAELQQMGMADLRWHAREVRRSRFFTAFF